MKYFYKIFYLFIVSIVIFGCKDKIVNPPNDKKAAIYGKIVAPNGNLLTNVNVHYIFYLGDNVELRNASITYSLPSSQNIIMQIYDMNNNAIAKPIDQYQNAGQYMIYFYGDSLTNGIYRYTINGQTSIDEGTFPLLTYDTGKLISTTPLTSSNNLGEFKIDYSILGIGSKYQIQNIQKELVVADSIKFVLHKEGFQNLIVSAKLDTSKVFEKTFTMIKDY